MFQAVRASEKRLFQELRGKWRYLRNHAGFQQAPLTAMSRLIRWRLHCALGVPATVNVSPWGARLFLPPQWRGAGTTMIFAVRGHYERELTYLRHFISPGMVVVDGGANCGIYSVAAGKLVGPSGRVIAFEPGAKAFSVLSRNIHLNHLRNVRAYCAALSDKDGTARLYHHMHGPNSFSLAFPKKAVLDSEEVVTRTLDEVIREEGLDRVGLIKLDVEGAEELALRGAAQVTARFRPTIIFEANPAAAEQLSLAPSGTWDLLRTWGYSFFFLTRSGDLGELDEPPAADDIINVIAVHRRRRK